MVADLLRRRALVDLPTVLIFTDFRSAATTDGLTSGRVELRRETPVRQMRPRIDGGRSPEARRARRTEDRSGLSYRGGFGASRHR